MLEASLSGTDSDFANSTKARPSGCSEYCSRDAVSERASSLELVRSVSWELAAAAGWGADAEALASAGTKTG